MASSENKLLQKWFAPAFKDAGFTKSGATWHRSRASLLHVFNIQGSSWSRRFDFNLGIYLTELGTLPRPSIADCHFQERLDKFVANQARFIEFSDFVRTFPEDQRRSELQTAINLHALPWFDRLNSLEQVRHYMLCERKKYEPPLTRQAHAYFGFPAAI